MKAKILIKKQHESVPVTDKAGYRTLFIDPAAQQTLHRRSVYIHEAYANIIGRLTGVSPGPRISIGGYINAVLEHHFETYENEIRDYYDSHKANPLGL